MAWPQDTAYDTARSGRADRATLRGYVKIGGWFLLWTLFGLFEASDHVPGPTPTWTRETVLIYLLDAEMWAVMSPAVIALARRYPIQRPLAARRTFLHLLASVGFSLAILLVFTALTLASGLGHSFMKMSIWGVLVPGFVSGIHLSVFKYWALVGVYHGLRYQNAYIERDRRAAALERRASELKTASRHAQLHALKAQIEPHFLFNALNTIMVLVRQESESEAAEMLDRLRQLLARVFRDANTQEVPLDRELENLRQYLAIEQVRFGDRLRIEISAAPDLRDAAVAYLCLQPIVENAIHHGVARSSAAVTIRVSAERHRDALKLQVEDDGPGRRLFEHFDAPVRWGIGLTNTLARLRQLYGDAATLEVEHLPQGGTLATMVMPYRALTSSCDNA